jgi:hypothetical protein
MKKNYRYIILLCGVVLLLSCQNKTKQLLAKKWDCVHIENLAPVDADVFSKEDSAAAEKVKTALQLLTWSFNPDNTYQCSVDGHITVQGTYGIDEDNKNLTCISSTKNSSNNYIITLLTENELVLMGTGTAVPLILHFKPH